jgi:hypothetical protein
MYRRRRRGTEGNRASARVLFGRCGPAVALCLVLTVAFASPIARAAGPSPSPDPVPQSAPSSGTPGPDPGPQATSGSGSGTSTSQVSQQPATGSSSPSSSSSSPQTSQATSVVSSANGSGVALGSPRGSSSGGSSQPTVASPLPTRASRGAPTPAHHAHRIAPRLRATGAVAASRTLRESLAGSLARQPPPQRNGMLLLFAAFALATVALAGASLLRLLRRVGQGAWR